MAAEPDRPTYAELQAELAALRSQEATRQQVAAIFRRTGEAITAQDQAGRLVYANEPAARLLGYPSPEALLAAPLADVLQQFEVWDEDGRPFPLDRLPGRLVLQGEDAPETVLRFRVRATGEDRWAAVRAEPVRDAAGRVIYAVNLFRDVTKQRAAEASLRASERCYRELFENANDILYTLDLRGRITDVNRAAEQITGFSRDELLAMPIGRLVAPEYHQLMAQMAARKAGGEPVTTYELEVCTKDGRRVPLEVSSRLIVEDGQAVGLQGSARDITARKQAEAALREREARLVAALAEAEAPIATRDRFLSIAAHELRTPLTPLKGTLQLLERHLRRGTPPTELLTLVQRADRRLDRLTALVNTLLDVSRIAAGRLVVEGGRGDGGRRRPGDRHPGGGAGPDLRALPARQQRRPRRIRTRSGSLHRRRDRARPSGYAGGQLRTGERQYVHRDPSRGAGRVMMPASRRVARRSGTFDRAGWGC